MYYVLNDIVIVFAITHGLVLYHSYTFCAAPARDSTFVLSHPVFRGARYALGLEDDRSLKGPEGMLYNLLPSIGVGELRCQR